MITANEIRLGNMVEIYKGAKTGFINNCQVISITGSSINDYDIDDIHGIPLTAEILIKCGFIKDDDLLSDFYILDLGRKFFRIDTKDLSIFYVSDVGMDGIILEADIDYLHQLQNLIFILTGNELNIQPL